MARMKPPKGSGVRVRMYNPGFGDCFLLAFRGRGGKPVYVLIDCGVHSGFKGGSDKIRRVIRDIRDATGGEIDLVVVTHEHADHVSGFYLGRNIFAGKDRRGRPDPKGALKVKQIWFGWTENPRSSKARRLDKYKKLLLQGLHASPQAMSPDKDNSVRSMLGFYAMDTGHKRKTGLPLGGDLLGVSTRDAREQVKKYAKKKAYLKPKEEPLEIPGVDKVRVFVLGPPTDEKLLLSPDPTGTEGEVFEGKEEGHHFRFGMEKALVAALGAADKVPAGVGDPPSSERYQPFSGNHRRQVEKVKARSDLYPFFHQHYGFEGKATGDEDSGEKVDSRWRRIDEEWQNSADTLALKLDSATNNTSLVLAIELEKKKRVLLFPGDAQVGNWKSWHIGGWSEKNGLQPGQTITAKDLLKRTVLYKVGHHGSHNATLQEQGLDLMTSADLMAMIPVDEKWARKRKPHSWKMPFGPMYKELKRRTRGRIIRTDHGVVRPEGNSAKARKERAAIKRAWDDFPGRVTEETELYTEVEIKDS